MDEEEDVDTSFGGVLPSEMRIAGPSLSDPSPVDGVLGSGGLGGVDIAEITNCKCCGFSVSLSLLFFQVQASIGCLFHLGIQLITHPSVPAAG